jgi:hypothetical protein
VEVTATCALFLAGKAEETPKKCKDIMKTVRELLNPAHFATFGPVGIHCTLIPLSSGSETRGYGFGSETGLESY